MGKKNESTTKFKADISNLKAGITQANSLIKSANAEFKNATAGMDNWSKSADGLEAKITQLDKTFSAQETIVKNLKEQYRLVCQQEGENSASAQQLADKINNAEARLKNTESQLVKYKDALAKVQTPTAELNAKIENQTADLKQLKDKYADVIIKEGENSASAKDLAGKIGDLSGELKENKEKLQDAKDKAEDLDKSFDDAGEAAEDSAEKNKDAANGGYTIMKDVLADLASTAIKEVVGGFKDMVSAAKEAYSETDAAIDVIVRKTGATGDALTKYKDAYNKVMSNVKTKAEDAGAAVGEIATRFKISDTDKLAEMSEAFIKFADINDLDVNSAVIDVAKAMKSANVKTENYSDILDLLTKSGQETGISVSTLTNQIITNGATLRKMGFDTETMIALLANMEDQGLDVSSMLAGFKTATKTWTKEGKNANKELKSLAKRLANSKTSAKATTEAMTLFGKSGTAVVEAMKNGKLSVSEMTDTLSKSSGTVKDTYEEIEDAGDKITIKMQQVKSKVGTSVSDFLSEHEREIGNFLDNVTGGFNELLDEYGDDIIDFAEKLARGFSTGFDWIVNHGDFVTTTLDTLGTIIVTKFAYSTIKNIASGVGGFFSSLKNFNADAIGTAISLVAGIATAAYDTYKNSMDAKYGISEMQKKAEESRSDFDEFKKSIENVAGQADSAATNEQRLKEKLLNLVDPMGKVKEGHEKEAQALANELNEELGANIKIRDNEIENLDKTIKLIDDLIEKKRAEAMMSGYKDTYTKALSEQSKKYAEYQAQKEKVKSLEAGRKKDEVNNEDYQKAINELEALKNDYETYTSTIELYEEAMTASANKNYKQMSICLDGIAGNIKTASAVSVLSLETQLSKSKYTYEQLIKESEKSEAGITQVQIDAAYDRYLLSAKEYDKGIALAKEKGSKEIEQYGLSVKAQTPLAEQAAKGVVDATTNELEKGAKKVSEKGKKIARSCNSAIDAEKGNAKATAWNFAASSYEGLTSFFAKYKFSDVAMNAVRGYLNELANPKNLRSAALAAANLGVTTLKGVSESLAVRSPSREMAKIGKFTIAGYVNELLGGRSEVAEAAKAVANSVLKEFDNDLNIKANIGFNLKSLDNIKRSIQTNPVQQNYERLSPTQSKGNTINNYTQNNYSPKALNNAEIYRQTKNALAYVKNKGW